MLQLQTVESKDVSAGRSRGRGHSPGGACDLVGFSNAKDFPELRDVISATTILR